MLSGFFPEKRKIQAKNLKCTLTFLGLGLVLMSELIISGKGLKILNR
jgi:hypothetical protein